jgi:hypothetical protein
MYCARAEAKIGEKLRISHILAVFFVYNTRYLVKPYAHNFLLSIGDRVTVYNHMFLVKYRCLSLVP